MLFKGPSKFKLPHFFRGSGDKNIKIELKHVNYIMQCIIISFVILFVMVQTRLALIRLMHRPLSILIGSKCIDHLILLKAKIVIHVIIF